MRKKIHPITLAIRALRGAKSIHGKPLPSKKEAVSTLRHFTGQNFGPDTVAWGKWLRKNRWVYFAQSDDPRLGKKRPKFRPKVQDPFKLLSHVSMLLRDAPATPKERRIRREMVNRQPSAFTSLDCPFCGACGRLVFVRTSDPSRVAFSCIECSTFWLDRNNITMESAIDPLPRDRIVSGIKILGWATEDDVRQAGDGDMLVPEIPGNRLVPKTGKRLP